MVVTRKKPIALVPPASRTNSSQPLPRAVKAKTMPLPAPSSSDKELLSQNQIDRKKIESPRGPTKFTLNSLLTIFLAVFSLYAITVCPTDYIFSSPVCRSVDAYRTRVLAPYVLPPIKFYVVPSIKAAISHPAVQPHIKTVQQTLIPLRPYLGKASDFERRKVRPHVKRSANLIVAASRMVWTRIIVPKYEAYLHPHLQPYTSATIAYYDRTVLRLWNAYAIPAYHGYSASVQDAYVYLQPHLVNAKSHFVKAYTLARSYGCMVYKVAKPRVVSAYGTLKPHVKVLARHLQVKARRLTKKVGLARRQFVDPHVRRIWDKVGEMSPVEDPVSAKNVAEDMAPVPTTFTSDEPLDSATSVILNSMHVAAQSGVLSELLSSVEETMSQTRSTEESATRVQETETRIPIPEGTAMATPMIEAEILVSASSVNPVSSTPTIIPAEQELDDFLRQIGLDEDGKESHDSARPAQQQQDEARQQLFENTKSEEEVLAKIAEKRAKLVSRHVRWQSELDAFVQEAENGARRVLIGIRKGAVNELLEMNKDEAGRNGMISGVETEGLKLLKGLEGYLKKAAGGQDMGVEREREREKWAKVVEKVEEKFTIKVRKMQEEVHIRYLGVREKEVQEVLRIGVEAKDIAEKAQADLGLDYAWLEDVTYEDWQKYHDLMRTSERFDNILRSIQAGTHARPPPDPLVLALDDLEHDLQDVIDGFTVRISQLREEAANLFTEPMTVEQGIPAVKEEEEPQVSILPVDPTVSNLPRSEEALEHLEHLLLGKSREQVIGALGDIEVEPRSHEDL